MSKKANKEEERWMMERAKQDHGAVALSKYYSKQEKKRKDRLKQVKSVVSSQMGNQPIIRRNRRPRPGGGGIDKPLRLQKDQEKALRQKKKKGPSSQHKHQMNQVGHPSVDNLEANPLGAYLEAFHKSWAIEDIQALAEEMPKESSKKNKQSRKKSMNLLLGFSPDGTTPQREKQKEFFSPGVLSARDEQEVCDGCPKHKHQQMRHREKSGDNNLLAAYNEAFSTDIDSALDLMDNANAVASTYEHLKQHHHKRRDSHHSNKQRRSQKKMVTRSQTEENNCTEAVGGVGKGEDEEEDEDRPWSSPAEQNKKHAKHAHANVQESARRKERVYNSAPVHSTRIKKTRHKEGHSNNSHLPSINQPIENKNLGTKYRDKRKLMRQRRHPGGGPKAFLAEEKPQEEEGTSEEEPIEELGSPVRFPMKPRHSKKMSPVDSNSPKMRKISGNGLKSPQRVRVALRGNKEKHSTSVAEEIELAKRRADRRRAAERLREHRRKTEEQQALKREEELKAREEKIAGKKSARSRLSHYIDSSKQASTAHSRQTSQVSGSVTEEEEENQPQEGSKAADSKDVKKALKAVGKQRRLKELKNEHEEALALLKELEVKPLSINPSTEEQIEKELATGDIPKDPSIGVLKTRRGSDINLDFSIEGLRKKADASNKFHEMFSARSGPLSRDPRPMSREDYNKWWKQSLGKDGPGGPNDKNKSPHQNDEQSNDTSPRRTSRNNSLEKPSPRKSNAAIVGKSPRQTSQTDKAENSLSPRRPSQDSGFSSPRKMSRSNSIDATPLQSKNLDAALKSPLQNSQTEGALKSSSVSNALDVGKVTDNLSNMSVTTKDSMFGPASTRSSFDTPSQPTGARLDISRKLSTHFYGKSSARDGDLSGAGDPVFWNTDDTGANTVEKDESCADGGVIEAKVSSAIEKPPESEAVEDDAYSVGERTADESKAEPQSSNPEQSSEIEHEEILDGQHVAEKSQVEPESSGLNQSSEVEDKANLDEQALADESKVEHQPSNPEQSSEVEDKANLGSFGDAQDDTEQSTDSQTKPNEDNPSALTPHLTTSIDKSEAALHSANASREDLPPNSAEAAEQEEDQISQWQAKVAEIEKQQEVSPAGLSSPKAQREPNGSPVKDGPAAPSASQNTDQDFKEQPSARDGSFQHKDETGSCDEPPSPHDAAVPNTGLKDEREEQTEPLASLQLAGKSVKDVSEVVQSFDDRAKSAEATAQDQIEPDDLLSPDPPTPKHGVRSSRSSFASFDEEEEEDGRMEGISSDDAKDQAKIQEETLVSTEGATAENDSGVEEVKGELPGAVGRQGTDESISALIFGKKPNAEDSDNSGDSIVLELDSPVHQSVGNEITASRRQSGWNEMTEEHVENLEVKEDIKEGEEGLHGKIFVGDGKYLSAPSTTSVDERGITRQKNEDESASEDDDDYEDEDFEEHSDAESSTS